MYTVTNSSCVLQAEYIYDAWGNCKVVGSDGKEITKQDHIGNINPFRYRGYYYDVETHLYWVSSRYYNPEWGRWISPDSIEYLDPESVNGFNLYAYCGNDPVNNADPSGHSVIAALLIAAGIGAAISGGVAIGGQIIQEGWNPGDWNWKSILGSVLVGAALGLATAAGGLVGIGAVSGWAAGGLFLGTTTLSFGAGAAQYALNYAGSDEFKLSRMFIDAGLTAFQSMISFGLGAAMSSSGMWRSLNKGEFSKSFSSFKSQGNNFAKSILKSGATYFKNNGLQMVGRSFVKNVFTIPYTMFKMVI